MHVKQAALIQKLIPSKVTEDFTIFNISNAIDFYKDDLPNPDIVDEELCRWKTKWFSMPLEDRPQLLTECLKQCSNFPNIFALLKLFATLPLSSCSCERSASALRRLNNYLRCTQSEERLSALALIDNNYDTKVNIDTVCKIFMEKHPRRMEHANMLFQSETQ